MNIKPYKQIEEQIKIAASEWEPAFDELAWQHMEQLLDKEDDRKRPFAWWWVIVPLVAGIATAGYFGFYKKENSNNETATLKQVNINSIKKDDTVKNNHNNVFNPQTNYAADINDDNPTNVFQNKNLIETNVIKSNPRNKKEIEYFGSNKKNTSTAAKTTIRITPAQTFEQKESGYYISTSKEESPVIFEQELSIKEKEFEKVFESPTDQQPIQKEKIEAINKLSTDTANKSITKKKQNKPGKPSNFYFSIYAGMEANGVDFPGLNKISTRAGFSAGYYLTKKLSVQSGFFAGSKKYIAGKYDYKAKPGTYWSTVDITKVDANCRVFEIPLSVRYDFKQSTKLTSFAGLGLSSFIMDKEDYAYDYIYYNTPHHGKASYTGNRHWFSVLRIYGGMEKKISQTISVGIQPGLAIPLGGVGEGQIKLFSSEVLLHLKYQPFKKAKSNQ